MAEQTIASLKENAIKVFEDCLLPNGALVAAPTHQPYYPNTAKSYMYMWPGRDGGFALAAMLLFGKDYYQQVLQWIWDRAEDIHETNEPEFLGLLFKSYHPNGLIREHEFQPDQGGTLLWSIGFKRQHTGKPSSELEKKIVKLLADNLIRVWDGDHFSLTIEELWENFRLKPGEGNYTYTLASCAAGLRAAAKCTGDVQYEKVAQQISDLLIKYCWDAEHKHIPRYFGGSKGADISIDGSLSGLVWPFNVGFPAEHLQHTIDSVEKNLVSEYGVHRYHGDVYAGAASHNHKNDQAGAWPLLTFWLSIALQELGESEKAKKHFDLVFNKVRDHRYIPEQLFCCKTIPWAGISPLLWSHAKAAFAAWKLGLL